MVMTLGGLGKAGVEGFRGQKGDKSDSFFLSASFLHLSRELAFPLFSWDPETQGPEEF